MEPPRGVTMAESQDERFVLQDRIDHELLRGGCQDLFKYFILSAIKASRMLRRAKLRQAVVLTGPVQQASNSDDLSIRCGCVMHLMVSFHAAVGA